MRNLFITLLLCIVAFTAKAQQMYEDKNIDYSFDSLKVEAAKGNVIAIFYLGGCYSSGRKANKTFYDRIDYDKAMEYYKMAYEIENYSTAFRSYRQEIVEKYILLIVVIVVVVLILVAKFFKF